MSFDEKRGRRELLRKLGKGLLGTLAGGIFLGPMARRADAGVFAGLFLKATRPVQIPPGYYDERLQLYVNATTEKPMFVRNLPEPGRYLTETELNDLGINLDVTELAKKQFADLGPGESCTGSTETTYSTTSCCPIVTDSRSDSACDDTPDKPM